MFKDFDIPPPTAPPTANEYTYYDQSETEIGLGPVLNLQAILGEIEAILELEYRLVNVYVPPDWIDRIN
jgi:hypothetical protein